MKKSKRELTMTMDFEVNSQFLLVDFVVKTGPPQSQNAN